MEIFIETNTQTIWPEALCCAQKKSYVNIIILNYRKAEQQFDGSVYHTPPLFSVCIYNWAAKNPLKSIVLCDVPQSPNLINITIPPNVVRMQLVLLEHSDTDMQTWSYYKALLTQQKPK